jgi:hypothetical protein
MLLLQAEPSSSGPLACSRENGIRARATGQGSLPEPTHLQAFAQAVSDAIGRPPGARDAELSYERANGHTSKILAARRMRDI